MAFAAAAHRAEEEFRLLKSTLNKLTFRYGTCRPTVSIIRIIIIIIIIIIIHVTLRLPSRNRGTDLPILNPDARWECMVKATPRRLYPRNGVAVPITQEEGWAQG
jgi:hypothetical protein